MTAQQGEVYVRPIAKLPEGLTPFDGDRDAEGRPIISHSEKGHHHVLPAGVTVMERPVDPRRPGLRILYALVENPEGVDLIQTAGTPHEALHLAPGVHELRISREYNPFAEEARRVAD